MLLTDIAAAPMIPVNPGTSLNSKGHPVISTNQFENLSTSYGSSVSGLGSSSSSILGPSHLSAYEDDDRRPGTPRNSSPSLVIPPEFAEKSSLFIEGNEEDLLVFGYGCKIFRDDERAKYIEDKKHLIPWMGDATNLIDRYDCRGALTDVSRYEPGNNAFVEEEECAEMVSELEEPDEEVLNVERYRDLNEDEDYDERALDRELNYKRLQHAMDGVFSNAFNKDDGKEYSALQYSYDEQNQDVCIGPEPKRLHEEDSPYVKPLGLYVPEEITLPTNMKVHAIIEKTAKFIASQGNQMEIILKTKQAANPLFEFLNHDGTLNAYYKFMVHAIRAGIYRPVELDPALSSSDLTSEAFQISSDYHCNDDESDHTYLHPSLLGASAGMSSVSPLLSVDSAVSYTAGPSNRHNAYSMLVSKIKGTDSPDPSLQQATTTPPCPKTSSDYQHNSGNAYNYNFQVLSSQSHEGNQSSVPLRPQKQLPSSQDQLIIEKMASYVIKNGTTFEVVAKSKGDPRFNFLDPSHEFHWYYLNCKERFKAECGAVVASSDFVNYGASSSACPTNNTQQQTKSSIFPTASIKKSALVAELAEKKKSISMSLKKESAVKNSSTTSTLTLVDDVFSRAKLVSAKDKEKPIIRFATSLTISNLPTTSPPKTVTEAQNQPTKSDKDDSSEKDVQVIPLTSVSSSQIMPSSKSLNVIPLSKYVSNEAIIEEKEEGEIDSELEAELDPRIDSDPFDDVGGNSTPVSEDDDEKMRRRMERKRKAALFLQTLKVSNTNIATTGSSSDSPTSSFSSLGPVPVSPAVINKGSSLGELLSRRLKASEEEESVKELTSIVHSANKIQEHHELSDKVNGNIRSRSSSSSEYSRRSRSHGHSPAHKKRKKRSRSRSYSSTVTLSSGNTSFDDSSRSSSSFSKKKSKKKHRKKKKKHEKSAHSSRKSKKR